MAAALNQPDRAERLFRDEIAEFQAAGQDYDAALAALDLAALLLQEGRIADALAQLDGTVRAFVERQVHRELFATLSLVRNAVAGGAGVEMIKTYAEMLRTTPVKR